MKKLNLLGLSVVTIGLLVGCGSNTDGSGVETGTGYYIDSAVQGIEYKCGQQEGNTSADGKFTFEVGKDCSFSVTGVPLRTTKADDLVDGVKVLEDDDNVARFLQSIDNDNNASNGIQIDSAILEVLTQALADHNSTGKVPTDTALDGVVTRVKDDVPTFEGRVKTPEEAAAHFAETLGDSLKELVSGKTFYQVGNDEGDKWIDKFVINENVTLLTITELTDEKRTYTTTLSINGNKLMHGDEGKYAILVGKTSDYLIVKDYDGVSRFYFNEAKAKAYYDSIQGSGSSTPSSTLSALIVGKTYYVSVDDSYTDANGNTVNNDHVETLAFGTDGKLHDTWIENGTQQEVLMDYSINGDTLSVVTPDDGTITFTNVETLSNHIRFTDANGEESGRLFFTYADAEATLAHN